MCLSQNINAQDYRFLRKGAIVPFDSAAVINHREYVRIRFKIMTADTLINSLNEELVKSSEIIYKLSGSVSVLTQMVDTLQKANQRKSITIEALNKNVNKAVDVSMSSMKFTKKPLFYIIASAVGTFIIIQSIKRL
jgi:hypothetical protein